MTLLAAVYAPPGRDAALPPQLAVLHERQLPVTLSHAQAERQWVWDGRYWRLLTTCEECGCGADTCPREQAGGWRALTSMCIRVTRKAQPDEVAGDAKDGLVSTGNGVFVAFSEASDTATRSASKYNIYVEMIKNSKGLFPVKNTIKYSS